MTTARPPARSIAAPVLGGGARSGCGASGCVRPGGPLGDARLPVLWVEGYGNGLFLPFRDATNGDRTYGAGRYLLDTVKGADQGGDAATGTLTLDFNLAFHPSCAHDPRWVCPLAPPASRAGDRRARRRAAALRSRRRPGHRPYHRLGPHDHHGRHAPPGAMGGSESTMSNGRRRGVGPAPGRRAAAVRRGRRGAGSERQPGAAEPAPAAPP